MPYQNIPYTVEQLHENPQLLKKYQKDDFVHYLKKLMTLGDVVKIDSFLALHIPPKKAVGVHMWNSKSNCFAFYEDYLHLALQHKHTNVFEYFYSQRSFKTNTIIDRLCSSNNCEMIDFILDNYPPTNIKNRTNLLFSALNDGYLEQFKLLLLHEKNSVDHNENENLLKKACLENKEDFVTALMIDCNLQLSTDMIDWLSGDNEVGTKFELPQKLVTLRELNDKLHNKLIKKSTESNVLEKKRKI